MNIATLWISAPLLSALERKGKYLTYTRPTTIYYCVQLEDAFVGVFGDGANGAYEWFIWDEKAATLRTSDCGYGWTGTSLCDGLVEAGASVANGDHDLLLSWKRQHAEVSA